MSVSISDIRSSKELREIISRDEYTLIDFWAKWCGPCKMISPIFDEEAKKEVNKEAGIRFYKVDIDEREDVAGELGISAVPSFFLFKNDQKVGQVLGADKNALLAMIAKAVESKSG